MAEQPEICFPPFRLDTANHRLWRGREEIPLRKQSLAVLVYLANHPDQLVRKQELLDALWPETSVTDTALKNCIREIRAALHDNQHDPKYIRTRHRLGYQFIAKTTTFTNSSFLNLPFSRNSFFTGREQIFKQVHEALVSAGKAVIAGLGGIGKTQTASEYAYRHSVDYTYLLWTHANSDNALISGFVALAALLSLPSKDAQDQNLAVSAVKRWLQDSSRWLLILDNVDDPKLLEQYLPTNPKGHILLTSRAQVFDSLGITNPITLDRMLPDEARQFLLRRTGRNNRDTPAETEAIQRLADELGCLPLALEQAAAYIVRSQCSFGGYLRSYRKRGLELLEEAAAVTGRYPKSVATTWSLNFEHLERNAAHSADLLRFTAFLNPDKIPLELITVGAAELQVGLSAALAHVETDPLVLDELLAPLTHYSLIYRNYDSETYSIHRLVQEVLKQQMDSVQRRRWAERTVQAVNIAYPNLDSFTSSNWTLGERLLPHGLACVELIDKYALEFPQAAALLAKIGFYIRQRGRLTEAEPLYKQALAMREKLLGEHHPHLANVLNNLAELYHFMGQYSKAEPLHKRALRIRIKVFGRNHTEVATSLNNLSGLYCDQGRYTTAKHLQRRALEIWKNSLGADHPLVAAGLNNLGAMSQEAGDIDEALSFHKEALEIREQVLEEFHPDLATSIDNLAISYRLKGDYKNAQSLHERALEIRKHVFGEDHPDVAVSLGNLATLFGAQGYYERAEILHKETLAIRKRVLGTDHPDFALSLSSLATLYHNLNRYEEAGPLYKQALEIREKLLGPQHPNTIATREKYRRLTQDIRGQRN